MTDNDGMVSGCHATRRTLILLGIIVSLGRLCLAQTNSGDKSWTTSSQQADPNGTTNPTRTRTTHTEVNGRIVEKTIVEARGPDGRYAPYSEIERESVRVNETTTRSVERSYGRHPDGRRMLTQETQEEARSLPDGESKTTRTTSNPDGNGTLQVVQRALIDSKQISPGVRETRTTLFSADGSGGLAATMQISERERKTDAATVEFTKSTSLSDGVGHWNLSEVREGTTRQDSGGMTKEERVFRPDSNGRMSVAERTVTRQSATTGGEPSEATETYSTSVAGQAGDEGLRLVRRENKVQHTGASGARSTTRQVEQTNPGDPGTGLRLTQEAIDIVRPDTDGTAAQASTILTSDSNGHLTTVWINLGSTDNPAAVKVDTAPAKKPSR